MYFLFGSFLSYLFIPLIIFSTGSGIIAARRGTSINHLAQMYRQPLLRIGGRRLVFFGIFFVGIGFCIFATVLGFHLYVIGTFIDLWTAGFIIINALGVLTYSLSAIRLSRVNFQDIETQRRDGVMYGPIYHVRLTRRYLFAWT